MSVLEVDSEVLENVARKAGWLGIGLIAVASLLPGSQRPAIGASGHVQHLLAYFLTALAFFYGRGGRGAARYILAFCAWAGTLELLQHFIPGRTPRFSDVLASVAGLGLGAMSATLARSVSVSGNPGARASEPAAAKTTSLLSMTEKHRDME